MLPGVTIGKNSIIGAGTIVTKNVPSNVVYAGNPGRVVCTLDDYLDKHKKEITSSPNKVFDKTYKIENNPT